MEMVLTDLRCSMGSSGSLNDAEWDRFGALFFQHAPRLVRLAALLGDDDPEDVVQEAFCKLYAARSRLRDETAPGGGGGGGGEGGGDASVVAYLNKIVVNEVRDRHRKRRVARRDAHLVATRDVAEPPAGLPGERSALVEALSRLPQRQREALVLRYWLDLPLVEIAHTMGVRVGTVKSQFSRGLGALEAALADHPEVGR